MTVFPATIADVPVIQHIASITWPVAYAEILSPGQLSYMLEKMYNQATLQQQITEEGHQYFLVSTEGKTVGFAGISPVSYLNIPGNYKQVFKLHKLYVLPTVHKTGAGKKLMESIFKFIRSQKGDYLVLNVNRKNAAVDYYVRKGFEIIEEGDFDIGSGFFMNDYIMGKPVESER
ncbi:MAG: GNAT family N-acetyltransferase [Bacteroidota bacterium]